MWLGCTVALVGRAFRFSLELKEIPVPAEANYPQYYQVPVIIPAWEGR